jgi:hypothetical protein
MYISLEEAKEEVWKRWNDTELRRFVQEYVKEIPEGFGQEPRAVYSSQLATLNFGYFRFAEKAKKVGLKPLCFEYTMDKFCSKNPDKRFLGKVTFFHHKGRNNGNRTTSRTIIDFCTEDGKPLREVKTKWGDNFVAFHHNLLASNLPTLELSDATEWYGNKGGSPVSFYDHLIALFICHGIHFVNYLDEGNEGKFTRDIVRPAIQRVTKHFGLKPLIVRLLTNESETDPYWSWYPGHLDAEVKVLLAGKVAESISTHEVSAQC